MDNREKLLDCALNLFSRRGFDAVGVREVVETAGVTKPTLYHYFDSKRGLLDALLAREAGRLLPELRLAACYQGDLVWTLESITRTYFRFSEQHPAFYRLQLAMRFAPPESEAHGAVQFFSTEQQAILEFVFIAATADHGNFCQRQTRYAVGFLGAVNVAIGLWLNQALKLDDGVVHQTVHQFMHGIFS